MAWIDLYVFQIWYTFEQNCRKKAIMNPPGFLLHDLPSPWWGSSRSRAWKSHDSHHGSSQAAILNIQKEQGHLFPKICSTDLLHFSTFSKGPFMENVYCVLPPFFTTLSLRKLVQTSFACIGEKGHGATQGITDGWMGRVWNILDSGDKFALFHDVSGRVLNIKGVILAGILKLEN